MPNHPSLHDQLDDFDPNAPIRTPWATFTVSRRPAFKMHATRGPALSRIKANPNSILYKWDDVSGQWIEVARHDTRNKPDPEVCENCAAAKATTNPNYWRFLHATWINKRGPGDPEIKFLCGSCSRVAR